MTLTRRSRKLRPVTLRGHSVVLAGGATIADDAVGPLDICEHQITWSEDNAWYKNKKYHGVQNIGGPFETVRTRYNANFPLDEVFLFGHWGYIARYYQGNILPIPLQNVPPALRADATDQEVLDSAPSLGDSTLLAQGASAISSSAPTSPVVDGSVAVAELYREGLPTLTGAQFWKNQSGVAKAAGGEYLNVAFGWLPLVSDIQATAKAVMDTETIVKQLLRDSGKNVRRHFTISEDKTLDHQELDPLVYPWPGLSTYHWSTGSVRPVAHIKTERSVWFDGCFTYHLDPDAFTGLEGAARQARLIYGVKLTPDVVWNLLPWSWLIDWVVNIGPVMKNLGLFANDGLTLRYGYTMEHTVVKRTWSWPTLERAPGGFEGSFPPQATFSLTTDRKRRLEQSPFVLGLTGSDFTLRRAAILGALGLTKMG